MRTFGSIVGLTGVGDAVFFGPFPQGTRLVGLALSPFNSNAFSDSVTASLGVFNAPSTLAGFGGGDFPFTIPSRGQAGASLSINGAPAFAVPIPGSLDIPLAYEMPSSGYIGFAVFDPAADAVVLAGIRVELPSREMEISTAPKGSVKAPTVAAKTSRGPNVVNRMAVPLPVQSGGKPSPQPTAPFAK